MIHPGPALDNRFLDAQFMDAALAETANVAANLEGLMTLGAPYSGPRTERKDFLVDLDPEGFTLWGRGESRGRGGHRLTSFSAIAHTFSAGVSYDFRDELFTEYAMSLEAVARRKGEDAPRTHERVFWQQITGASDAELLPSTLTAADGGALFTGTVNGHNRYYIANGNAQTSAGTSVANRETDLTNALSYFRNMRTGSTSGRPRWNAATIDQGIDILCAPGSNEATFEEVLYRDRSPRTNGPASPLTVNNGQQRDFFRIRPTAYLSGDTVYFKLRGAPAPLAEITDLPLQEDREDMSNSDGARRTGEKGLWYHFISTYVAGTDMAGMLRFTQP